MSQLHSVSQYFAYCNGHLIFLIFFYVFIFCILCSCATFYIFRNTLCVARHFVHCSHFIFLWLIFQSRIIFVLLDFLYISFSLCFPILCPLQSFGPRGIFFFLKRYFQVNFLKGLFCITFFQSYFWINFIWKYWIFIQLKNCVNTIQSCPAKKIKLKIMRQYWQSLLPIKQLYLIHWAKYLQFSTLRLLPPSPPSSSPKREVSGAALEPGG